MYTLTLMSNYKGVIMKISEIAKETGLTVRAIRYYEELNLIKSDRLDNNYRDFDKEALFKVSFISRARKLGFSVDECSSLIKLFNDNNRHSSEVIKIAKIKRNKLNDQIKELQDLKKSLDWLIKKCPGDDKPNCPILDELSS